jgi:hypothetical protein
LSSSNITIEEGANDTTAQLIIKTPTDLLKGVQKYPEAWFLAFAKVLTEHRRLKEELDKATNSDATINDRRYELGVVPRYDPTYSESAVPPLASNNDFLQARLRH